MTEIPAHLLERANAAKERAKRQREADEGRCFAHGGIDCLTCRPKQQQVQLDTFPRPPLVSQVREFFDSIDDGTDRIKVVFVPTSGRMEIARFTYQHTMHGWHVVITGNGEAVL